MPCCEALHTPPVMSWAGLMWRAVRSRCCNTWPVACTGRLVRHKNYILRVAWFLPDFSCGVTVGQDRGKLCCSRGFREQHDNRKHTKQRRCTRLHAHPPLHNAAGCYIPGVAARASVDSSFDQAACAVAVVKAPSWEVTHNICFSPSSFFAIVIFPNNLHSRAEC